MARATRKLRRSVWTAGNVAALAAAVVAGAGMWVLRPRLLLSLYFFNPDGHARQQSERDYEVIIFRNSSDQSPIGHCRVQGFYEGVYKRFELPEAGEYQVDVSRNAGVNCICSAVFLDPPFVSVDEAATRIYPFMYEATYRPVPVFGEEKTSDSGAHLEEYLNLCRGVTLGASPYLLEEVRRYSLRSFRAGQLSRSESETLFWESHLWKESHRSEFDQRMKGSWMLLQQRFPQFRGRKDFPLSPNTR